MSSAKPRTEQALTLARELGLVTPRDLAARHLPHTLLAQLHQRGRLERVARGLYRLPDHEATEHFSLAAACRLVPGGVVCLLTALRFHDLGTQDPFQVWMAIHPKAWAPQIDYPPLRIVRFSGPALTEGIEEHDTTDGSVRVYSLPKTVVDCFRFRNKIGLDVALEALQAALRERRATVDELWQFASRLRMANIMCPYLEASV